MRPPLAIAALVLLIPTTALGQNQKPTLFADPRPVLVGSSRIETVLTWAQGKWSNADKNLGTNSTIIHCYRRFGFCEEAESYLFGGLASVNLTTLDIQRWDDAEMIAIDDMPLCEVDTVRFDFHAKQVTYTVTLKRGLKNLTESMKKLCQDTKPVTAFLGGR